MKYQFTKELLMSVVDDSLSIADVCRKINIRPCGGNYKTLKKKFNDFSIDTSHFTGQAWNVGNNFRPFKRVIDINEILVEDSTYTNNFSLKKRLFNEGIFERKCQICDISEWMGKPVPTELDHINGNNTDNRIENLRILCPNCHAQTDNFRGKGKKNFKLEKKKEEYVKLLTT
jgi:hypothetical protein